MDNELVKETSIVTESIFGDLDTSEIPDDPYYVAPNTYFATCTDAKILKADEDSTKRILIFTWTINEPDSEYHKKSVRERYALPVPGITWKEQEADVRTALTYLKTRLREAFDMTDIEIAQFGKADEPIQLLNQEAYITTSENSAKDGSGRTFSNVRVAKSKRLYEEENDSSSFGSSIGL